jgi:hypothetical protein
VSLLKSTFKSFLGTPGAEPAQAQPGAAPAFRPPLPTMRSGNPLLEHFVANGGHVIHKWLDYFDVYHRAFERFRGLPIKFLEIGVQNGGSTRMWREYFGPQATIIGMDIDPRCRELESEGFEVWIGDQADPGFWREFQAEHPDLDVVLDDGGHTMVQQITTFEALFPVLRDGGVYLCEDTHTSYFPAHGGGLRREGTFHEYVKGLIDDMHAWYHAPLQELQEGGYMARHLRSIAVHDSVVVFEKRRRDIPLAVARGTVAAVQNPPAMTFLDMRRAFGVPD